MIPVVPAGNSLLRFSTRTSGAPAPGACVVVDVLRLDADAGDIVIRSLCFEWRIDRRAVGNCARASRMKSASGGRIQGARNRTGNRAQTTMGGAVDAGDRFGQSLRVRVQRIAE